MGNDGAFINPTLIEYCTDQGIEFPRSRAYRQNDQARIKHKNGAVARRFADYDCYAGQVAGQTVAHLYGAVGLYVDYFQPSFKLLNKNRDGATVVKRHSPPPTPCDRFIHRQTVSAELKEKLGEHRARWTRWRCCPPLRRPNRRWWRIPLRIARVRRTLPTPLEDGLRAIGGLGGIPSRASGAPHSSGCRPNRMPQARH